MKGGGLKNVVGKFFDVDEGGKEDGEGGGGAAERRLERWLPTESALEFVFGDGETSSSSRCLVTLSSGCLSLERDN